MTRGSEQLQALRRPGASCGERAGRYLAARAGGERKREARAEYRRVLRIFSDLIMKGKTPPE